MFRHLLVTVSLLVLALMGLAAISPVHEVAIAEGQIMPESSVLRIQHFEGGIINEILVEEGQIVEADQILGRLAPIAVSNDFDQLKKRRSHLAIQKIRLSALISGEKPNFSEYETDYRSHVAEQRNLYHAEFDAAGSEASATEARIAQRRSEYEASKRELVSVQSEIGIYTEQLSMRESLLKTGYTSRRAYLETKVELEKARSRRAQTVGQMRGMESSIAEAVNQLAQLKATKLREWSRELSDITAQIAELDNTLAKHRDRVNRLDLRAPVKGVIQEVGPKGIGEVLGAGDLFARLVPIGDEIIAEVRVMPEDIGHVQEGYEAEIRVTAFDSEVFGKLKGKVQSLSPTTFKNEEGVFYYRANLALESDEIQRNGNVHPILPGMVVQAEIITGAKSVLKYLIKPVARALDKSFTER